MKGAVPVSLATHIACAGTARSRTLVATLAAPLSPPEPGIFDTSRITGLIEPETSLKGF